MLQIAEETLERINSKPMTATECNQLVEDYWRRMNEPSPEWIEMQERLALRLLELLQANEKPNDQGSAGNNL